MTGKLTIEGEEDALADIFDHATALVHKYEPDVEVRRA